MGVSSRARSHPRVIRPPYAELTRIDGGWRLTTGELPPSQNTLDREFWAARKRRVDRLSLLFWSARNQASAHDAPPERAVVRVAVYYPTVRARDWPNVVGGLKQHVDAMVRVGLLAADDADHMHLDLATLAVDRERPRVEFEIAEWTGLQNGQNATQDGPGVEPDDRGGVSW